MSCFGLENLAMRAIQVKQLNYDLTPTAGLAVVGHFLKTLAPALADVHVALQTSR